MQHRPDDRVRAVATQIPAGDVLTYGEIAHVTGLNPRHVGRIVARISGEIPWWRIIRADGTPPTCHGGCAADILRQEQVPFAGSKVNRYALVRMRTAPPAVESGIRGGRHDS